MCDMDDLCVITCYDYSTLTGHDTVDYHNMYTSDQRHFCFTPMYYLLVYVIAWVAVVFGINCASNVGRKLVIVRGAAEHYYCFLPTLREQLIPNTMANHAITN